MFIVDIYRKSSIKITTGGKSVPTVSFFIFAVIILSLLKLGLFLKQIPEFATSISLIEGFAPLIGLIVLHILLVVIYIFFFDKVEKTFEEGSESFSRESSRKKMWQINRNDTVPHNVSSVFLKEHSPPYVVLSK